MEKKVSEKVQEEILLRLRKTYPKAKIVLKYGSYWELLIAVILSAQCTDIIVNKVTEILFQKYKTLDDYVNANQSEFENDIKSTGFYRNKAKNILATAKIIKEKYGGVVPNTMKDLLPLPGCARKTANIVLGNAYGVVEGIAVDTHVARISQRLRLVDIGKIGGKRKRMIEKKGKQVIDFLKDADPNKIELSLMKTLPKSEWFSFTYRVIDHGRSICKAANPLCGECVLSKLCPVSRV
ncbi:endonuclease III [Candidatus Gottesmanbacteria bacterium]|nr:endonuclease III [Candidatus Gottesmanbacteria bacterium]